MAAYSRFGVGLAALFRVWFEPEFARHYVGWIASPQPPVKHELPSAEETEAGAKTADPKALAPATERSENPPNTVEPKVPQSGVDEAPVKAGNNAAEPLPASDETQPLADTLPADEAAKALAAEEKVAAPEAKAATGKEADVGAATERSSDASIAESVQASNINGALLLLGLLQREGRLVDFIEQDIVTFSDADVGAAARVIHAGCRKVLHQHLQIKPLLKAAEGDRIELAASYSAQEYKVVGDVPSSGRVKGRLKHPGWRASDAKLPSAVGSVDYSVISPAEVEV